MFVRWPLALSGCSPGALTPSPAAHSAHSRGCSYVFVYVDTYVEAIVHDNVDTQIAVDTYVYVDIYMLDTYVPFTYVRPHREPPQVFGSAFIAALMAARSSPPLILLS